MVHFLVIFFILTLVFLFTSTRKYSDINVENTNKSAFVFCVFMLCFLSGFRSSNVGNDTIAYIYLFDHAAENFFDDTRFEIGYVYLNYYLSQISRDPQILFVTVSVFIYFSFGRYIWKHSAIPWISLLLFFILYFGSTVNIIRQMIAVGILLWSIKFVVQRQPIYFAIIVLLAITFHTTAVFFIPAYFVPLIPMNKKALIVILGSGIVGYLLFAPLLDYMMNYLSIYEGYLDSKYFQGEVRLATMIQILISLGVSVFSCHSFLTYTDEAFQRSEEGAYVKFMIIMQFISVAIYIVCLKVNLLDRVALYFSIFSFINIANAISFLPEYKRRSYSIMIICVLLLYSAIVIVERPDWNRVYPYEFCWQDRIR